MNYQNRCVMYTEMIWYTVHSVLTKIASIEMSLMVVAMQAENSQTTKYFFGMDGILVNGVLSNQ